MTLGVKVPDYQIDKRFWPDQHYEGGNLFRDTAIVEVTPPKVDHDEWSIKLGWASQSDFIATKKLKYEELRGAGTISVGIPFSRTGNPGITGTIQLRVQPWNTEH